MGNLIDAANNYESSKVGNIADLESVSVEMELVTKIFNEGKDNEFTVDVITVEGSDYRVPKSVIGSLQTLLRANPDIKNFKVIKTGTTVNDTKYTVMPLFDQ